LHDSEADVNSLGDENSSVLVADVVPAYHKSEQYYIFSDEDKNSEIPV
jgi:hypothetical protein